MVYLGFHDRVMLLDLKLVHGLIELPIFRSEAEWPVRPRGQRGGN